ncbi:hypothetical protein CGCVW01_v005626 [Colletotrichum viniferum]|nr:hypothetical protein CGCVW01_v005626 [Colletotrichum viniferum]
MRGLGAVAALAASLSTISQAQSLDDFASPPNIYRPKFRYWLPDAEVDIEAVTRDVAETGSVGAGGLEFLPYYQFRSPSANWSTYGYGINASRAVFRTAMQAAADNDHLFDFSIGANQGQGVPSEPESVGLALELNTWRIMAWFTRYTNQRSIDAAPDAVSWLQNGSWITDHFSAAGAKKLTGFFDEFIILEEEDKKLLARVGKYAQKLFLCTVRRGLAGGVSMSVFHGYAYSGVYAQTTWPGYTVFSYTFTNMWGPRMPAWRSRHDGENSTGFMADAMAYVARNQFISQADTARVDLAFYQYAAPFAKDVYGSDNLEKMGFTYEYLGPGSFSSSNAIVGEGGVLAPDGPAYKALIFADQTKLTPEMAAQTEAFAEAGLPIFVIGSTNFQSVGVDGAASVLEIMAQALAKEGVTVLASVEELPAALAALDIRPRVSFPQDNAVENFLDVAGRTPYTLNAWTGSASPLLQYTIEENHMVVPVTLAANQTTILAFFNQTSDASDENGTSILPRPLSTHITSTFGPLEALLYTATQDVNTTTATNNTRITAHLAPGTSTDMDPVNLGDTSGTADYETTFPTPFSSVADQRLGARLHLGAITDAAILWVNGDKVIFDVNSSPDLVVDITNYLNPAGANNVVKVEVASTLCNRVRADQDSTMTFGVAASVAGASFFKANPTKEYGLKGPVSVQWVEVVDVL